MTDSIQNLTDAQLAAAADHPHTMPKHRAEVEQEIARRGAMRASEWDIVSRAFDEPADECRGCEYYFYEYYTDIGASSYCGLGDYSGHDPRWCAAYDRIEEELQNDDE